MAPALLVELGCKSRWHPRCFAALGGIASRAGRAWRRTAAGVVAIPRSVGMTLIDPGAVLAEIARHGAFGSRSRFIVNS
jgi:hypothetical protein